MRVEQGLELWLGAARPLWRSTWTLLARPPSWGILPDTGATDHLANLGNGSLRRMFSTNVPLKNAAAICQLDVVPVWWVPVMLTRRQRCLAGRSMVGLEPHRYDHR